MRLGEKDANKHHTRRRRRRTAQRTFVFILVLMVLFGGAGFAYTWYAGQQTVEPAVDVTKLPSTKPERNVNLPTKNSQVGVAVQSFTTPVKRGENASITIKTLRGAACSITFTYNETEERSKDTGLIPKIADEYGFVEWTWTVSPSVSEGTWPVEIVCAYENRSSYSRSDLEVVN